MLSKIFISVAMTVALTVSSSFAFADAVKPSREWTGGVVKVDVIEAPAEPSWAEWFQDNAPSIAVSSLVVGAAVAYIYYHYQKVQMARAEVVRLQAQQHAQAQLQALLQAQAQQQAQARLQAQQGLYHRLQATTNALAHLSPDECKAIARRTNQHLPIIRWEATGEAKFDAYAGVLKQRAGGVPPQVFAPGETYSPDEFAEDWNRQEQTIWDNTANYYSHHVMSPEDEPLPVNKRW